MLNGNGRPYHVKPAYGSAYAKFGGVVVEDDRRLGRGGAGVFEVAARVSAIDLSDRDVRGGSERDITLGLNWYPEPNVRLVGDSIHVDAVSSTVDRRQVEADILAGRLQFSW